MSMKRGELEGLAETEKTMVEYEDIDVVVKEEEKPGLILYSYRWVVLISFFLSSAATGSVQGSLSTNRKIIENIKPDLNREVLSMAKYSDLIMYLPANFFSVWLIDRYGLRVCISFGCSVMLLGSLMRFTSSFTDLWFWYFGHIICMSSQAFLKNPVTKLASNWFGDKERSLATAIGIVSGPLGIFISKILIITIFEDKHKNKANSVEAEERWKLFMTI
jgi:FLVCR family feline leukemia virus subgroup C receptor-related protein